MADGCCSDYHFRMTTDFGFILKDICARADADRIELIALSDIARWTGKAFNPQTPDTEFLTSCRWNWHVNTAHGELRMSWPTPP